MRRECEGELQVPWQSSSTLERKALKVIAQRTVPLTGREAEQRFGLANSGSTQLAVERLVGDGHLVPDDATRCGLRIVDPFLGAWLREER